MEVNEISGQEPKTGLRPPTKVLFFDELSIGVYNHGSESGGTREKMENTVLLPFRADLAA